MSKPERELRSKLPRGEWLDLRSGAGVGVAVDDACWASRSPSGWMVSHSDPWHVSCTRNATVVYATSGDAVGPLSALADSVGAAGRGYYGPRPSPRSITRW